MTKITRLPPNHLPNDNCLEETQDTEFQRRIINVRKEDKEFKEDINKHFIEHREANNRYLSNGQVKY